jgi:hypothetical protein
MSDVHYHCGVCHEAADRWIQALGGRAAVERAAVQRTRATGSRHHPGWGPVPDEPELVAEFLFDLVEDLDAARYRLQLSGPTHLVPVNLDYTEIGDGLAGHVVGVDFMFDPRPVDMPIPSWRVAARQRHIDLTSPLRIARKTLRSDVGSHSDRDRRSGLTHALAGCCGRGLGRGRRSPMPSTTPRDVACAASPFGWKSSWAEEGGLVSRRIAMTKTLAVIAA